VKRGFFHAVKAGLVKTSTPTDKPKEDLDSAIRERRSMQLSQGRSGRTV